MLPYPDMDFVPLDILAAAELNQLVMNINALSDGSGIAPQAIKSPNIDFATLNNNNKAIQVGTWSQPVMIQGSAGNVQQVTFSEPFDNPPEVVAQIQSGSADVMGLHIQNITTTGFQAIGRKSGTTTGNYTCTYIAIDVSKLLIN